MNMKNNQYYPIDLAEIKNGFEFETTYTMFRPAGYSGGWIKVKFDIEQHGWIGSAYEGDAMPDEFRVKRLDASDIVECGWEYFDVPDGKYLIDNYYRLFMPLKQSDHIEFRLRKIGDNITIWAEETLGVVFSGNLKNKSELLDQMRRCRIGVK